MLSRGGLGIMSCPDIGQQLRVMRVWEIDRSGITRVMAGIDKEQDVDVGQNGRPRGPQILV
jgi:hypothetical protein